MPTITIRDETSTGRSLHELTLELLTERLTVRELIRSRVYQEVQDFNVKRLELFRGLVQPKDSDQLPQGGYRPRKPGATIDWQQQFERAVEAFEKDRFFVLVDDRQVEGLEQEIVVTPATRVTFVQLVPLVGG